MDNGIIAKDVMTVRQIADALKCSSETVRAWGKKLFPEKLKNGVVTYFNEEEVTAIKLSMGQNPHLQNSLEVVTTDLEMALQLEQAGRYFKAKYEEATEKVQELTPKAIVYDKFISAENNQSISTVAKLFRIGEYKFFKMLREQHILMKDNIPYQEHMRYFEVKDIPVRFGMKIENKPTTFVRPEGVEWLAKKFNMLEMAQGA